MKVAFVSGNRERLPDAVLPLGLLYVMASTPARHQRVLLDLCFEPEPELALRTHVDTWAPDVVALGMRNIQRADYTGTKDSLDYYAGLIEAIRGVSEAPVVLGGSGFSVMPEALMQRLEPDYGISGEGEQAFATLLEALEAGAGLDAVPALHRFVDGRLVSNAPPARFQDLDALPGPDRTLVDDRYYRDFGIDSVQTKRGCPLRCDYCTYPRIEGRVGRLRDPARVADEFERIARERPEAAHVFVVDSVFNLPLAHAKAVCRTLTERGNRLPWTCYANPLGFDRELAECMAAAGCAGMEVGSDSGSESALKRLRKGFTTDHVRRLHALARDAGIPDCHTFILGTPGESLDDVRRTLDFVVDLDPFSVILMVWTDDAEAVEPGLRAGRRAFRESVLEILEERKHAFPWWSIPELGVNHDRRLFRRLRQRGLRGPLWQHARGLIDERPAERRRRPRGEGDQSPSRKKGASESA